MAYVYLKLKARIIEKYGSQAEFAKVIGVSETTVSNKMSERTQFSKDDMLTWGEALDIPVGEFGNYFFAQKL